MYWKIFTVFFFFYEISENFMRGWTGNVERKLGLFHAFFTRKKGVETEETEKHSWHEICEYTELLKQINLFLVTVISPVV